MVRALIDLEGVERVRVFWPEGVVRVALNSVSTRTELLAEALAAAGFPAAPMDSKAPSP